MELNDSDIYHDLDGFHEEELKKTKELLAWEAKYTLSLQTIDTLKAENKSLTKKIKTIEVNFQNLLDTAKAEIKRKDRLIAQLRKEKDDICFRRKPIRPTGEQQQDNMVQNGNSLRHNRFDLKTESYESTNSDAQITGEQVQEASERISPKARVDQLKWSRILGSDKANEQMENSSSSGPGRQYSNNRKSKCFIEHEVNTLQELEKNLSKDRKNTLHNQAHESTSKQESFRPRERERYRSTERAHKHSRERNRSRGRNNNRLYEHESHRNQQEERAGSRERKYRSKEREQYDSREHRSKMSRDRERHRSHDRERHGTREQQRQCSREKELDHHGRHVSILQPHGSDTERNSTKDIKNSDTDRSSSKETIHKYNQDSSNAKDDTNCRKDVQRKASAKDTHRQGEIVVLTESHEISSRASFHDKCERHTTHSNVIEGGIIKTLSEECVPSANVDSKIFETEKAAGKNKETEASCHNTAPAASTAEVEHKKVTSPPDIDENLNFAAAQQLNTPKKVALYDALFGPSPSSAEIVNSKLFTNVMEILRNGSGSATTSPGTYTDVSEKDQKESTRPNENVEVKAKMQINADFAGIFKENKTVAVCEPETKRLTTLERSVNTSNFVNIFQTVGTFKNANMQCIPALGNFDDMDVDTDIHTQTSQQQCNVNETEIIDITDDAVVHTDVAKITVNGSSNAVGAVERSTLELISDETLVCETATPKRDKRERIQIIEDIRLPTLFELPTNANVLQASKHTQEGEAEMETSETGKQVDEIVDIVNYENNIEDISVDKELNGCANGVVSDISASQLDETAVQKLSDCKKEEHKAESSVEKVAQNQMLSVFYESQKLPTKSYNESNAEIVVNHSNTVAANRDLSEQEMEENIENVEQETETLTLNVETNALEKEERQEESIKEDVANCKLLENGFEEGPVISRGTNKSQMPPAAVAGKQIKAQEAPTTAIANAFNAAEGAGKDVDKKKTSQTDLKPSETESTAANFVLVSTVESPTAQAGNHLPPDNNENSRTELSTLYKHTQCRDTAAKSAPIENGLMKETEAETAVEIAMRQLHEIENSSKERRKICAAMSVASEVPATVVVNNPSNQQHAKALRKRKAGNIPSTVENLEDRRAERNKRKVSELEAVKTNAIDGTEQQAKRLKASASATTDVVLGAAEEKQQQQLTLQALNEKEAQQSVAPSTKEKLRKTENQQPQKKPAARQEAVESRKKSTAAERTNNAKYRVKTTKRQNTPERSETAVEVGESPVPIQRCRRRLRTKNALRILDTSSSDDEEQQPLKTAAKIQVKHPKSRGSVEAVNAKASSPLPLLATTEKCAPATTPMHEIFQCEGTMERQTTDTSLNHSGADASARLPLMPANTSQEDAQFNEIDSRLQSMFQSPPYDAAVAHETTAEFIAELDNSTSHATATHLTIDETIDTSASNTTLQANATPLDASFEQKHISLGSSDYRFEKVSENVVNLYITRKRGKKKKSKALPADQELEIRIAP